jgi:uroporphyrin-III C-methyltransferase
MADHVTRLRAREGRKGLVSLVGAGPGDPELLTLGALRRLQEADVVYHDALVDPRVLALCRPETRRVPVGKRRGAASAAQEAIQEALVRDARAGRRVVRLKGGDPFVFGRGGEEALALLEAGVPFEVVPGVSSGVAVPALAGIPLTHRGLASSAAFVTAHDLSDGPEGRAVRDRLAHLARGAETIVLFMAGAGLAAVQRTLLAAGLPAATPAAVIESGSLPGQEVRRGVLGGLERLGDGLGAGHGGGPVMAVVGRTVALAAALGDAVRDGRALAAATAGAVGAAEAVAAGAGAATVLLEEIPEPVSVARRARRRMP